MFLENNENGIVYMTSDRLPFRHMFTTRYGGVSTGHLATLNLIGGHGDSPENLRENFTRVAALFGKGPDDWSQKPTAMSASRRSRMRPTELSRRSPACRFSASRRTAFRCCSVTR